MNKLNYYNDRPKDMDQFGNVSIKLHIFLVLLAAMVKTDVYVISKMQKPHRNFYWYTCRNHSS